MIQNKKNKNSAFWNNNNNKIKIHRHKAIFFHPELIHTRTNLREFVSSINKICDKNIGYCTKDFPF